MRRGRYHTSGICGWRHVLRRANFVDIASESIETELSPSHCETSQATAETTSCLGCRATPSILTSKSSSRSSLRALRRWGLQGPPGLQFRSHEGTAQVGLRGKSTYIIVEIWPTGWLETELYLPMYPRRLSSQRLAQCVSSVSNRV